MCWLIYVLIQWHYNLHLITIGFPKSSKFLHCCSLYVACVAPLDLKCACLCYSRVHPDLRAHLAHQAPLAPLGQTALMWVYAQVCSADCCHKGNHCAGDTTNPVPACSTAVLPAEGCKWKHADTKRPLFPAERGVFEKGPLLESSVCVTVMWYIQVWFFLFFLISLWVNYIQVV